MCTYTLRNKKEKKEKRKYPKAIYNWPEDERPRERLLKFGADKLSDTELLAILLRVGASGEPHPGQDDIEITNCIISACKLVGIKLLDHIIIGDNHYFSFYDEGLIKEE